jgi:hypothetical protein
LISLVMCVWCGEVDLDCFPAGSIILVLITQQVGD